MVKSLNRRTFLAAAAAAASVPFSPLFAQSRPVKIGLLTVKTGPLAQGGMQMEQGLTAFLKERGYVLAGRKVELISADTGGNPAGARTKAQELVERDSVDFVVGPLAAFELIAISDYMKQARVPMLGLAGADEMTQNRANEWFIRASATSSQCCHPLGHYAATEMGLKHMATIVEDFAFGYEQAGGFHRSFVENGGTIEKRLWAPIVTPDYTPYLAQLMSGIDGLWQGFAGSNPVKFMRQLADFGLNRQYPVVCGWTALDDALLRSFGDEAVGSISAAFYSAEYESPSNKRFVEAIVEETGSLPGGYATTCYVNGMCIEAALEATGGSVDDKEKTMDALRAVSLEDTPRGAFHFDHLGNVVGNVFIRRLDRRDGELVNTIVKTYENVGQFWTYDEGGYLGQPVYSRDRAPAQI